MRASDRPTLSARLLHGGVLLAILVAVAALGGCAAAPARLIKIGLVGPFEGRYREIGYDVIPAARLALREYAVHAAQTGVAVELVAYDDLGDPDHAVIAAEQAVNDPAVRIVIGHWRDATTLAGLPVYSAAGVPLVTFSPLDLQDAAGIYNLSPHRESLEEAALTVADDQAEILNWMGETLEDHDLVGAIPEGTTIIGGPDPAVSQLFALLGERAIGLQIVLGAGLPSDTPLPEFESDTFENGFKQGSLGAPPGLLSLTGYLATWQAIRIALGAEGVSFNPEDVPQLQFDASGRRVRAPIFIYEWGEQGLSFVEMR